jgi:2,3-dimethylmalate lyase
VSPETLVVIRTDALMTDGFDEAIRRAEMYGEAGADILFVEAPTSEDQVCKIPKLLNKPCVLNMSFGDRPVGLRKLQEMGYAIVIYPVITLVGAIEGALRMCTCLMTEDQQAQNSNLRSTFDELEKMCGLKKFQELERKFV